MTSATFTPTEQQTYEQQVTARRTELLGHNNRRKDHGEPLTDTELDAVMQLDSTPCPDPRRVSHKIPARSTICIYCGADALDINRLDY